MKINKLHLLWNMAALLLCASAASCSQDELGIEQGEPLPPGKYLLSLTATVGTPQTRAEGMDDWQGGEVIAVNIGDYTGKYIMDASGNATASDVPYYWQNTATATVSAWYPYAEGDQTYAISNQSQGYAAFDFLYAETEGSYAAPVLLDFSHQMAKVSYTLVKGQGICDADLAAATVTLLGDKSVTVSGGKITADPTSQTDEITPCPDAASLSGSAVMVPQNMTGKPLIKVNINGNNFIYTPDTEDAGNLQAGYQHSYTITVKANGIEVAEATGGEWMEDGNENVGITIIYDGTEPEVKIGDYYYGDGTWSDGGLRKLYSDGTMKWAETTPQPVSGKTCIGIVFYTGRHETDRSNYSQPLTEDGPTIPEGVFHGYVVALTDVHNDDNDLLRWEYGPKNEYGQVVGTSIDKDDWNGYSNCLKFHEFVDDATNKEAGWEMKHFPATLACETYGKRMLDQDGNDAYGKYDWQQKLAAPANTSGWFLPSCGQLKHLYQNSSLLSPRMDVVKSSVQDDVPNDYSYRDYIKWFSTSVCYWSSTESSFSPSDAWSVYFDDGYGSTYSLYKLETYGVRAVLAF